MLLSKRNLDIAFKMFDADNSGKISAQELKNVLSDGMLISEKIWSDIITEVDENGDGEVDLKEFTDIVLSKV